MHAMYSDVGRTVRGGLTHHDRTLCALFAPRLAPADLPIQPWDVLAVGVEGLG